MTKIYLLLSCIIAHNVVQCNCNLNKGAKK